MDDSDERSKELVGRRRFLTSLFGLTAMSEQAAEAAHAGGGGVHFYWTNLRNGQIAFPTGMDVPSGQPGSVMKLVTGAALHEAGLFAHDETIECRGVVRIDKHEYKCLYPHGRVNLTHAIGLSCNVFFAEASQKLSPTTIVEYADKLGFNKPIAGYTAASFPKSPSGDPAQYGLGLAKDLAPNALQILRLAALVGLNGQVPPMHNAAEYPNTEQPFSVELQPSTWHLLQQGMRLADRQGTGKKLDPSDTLKLAVKTGTSPHGKTYQSWITGYFPYDEPRYAFCLRAPSGTSQDRAVPEAHKFLFAAPWP